MPGHKMSFWRDGNNRPPASEHHHTLNGVNGAETNGVDGAHHYSPPTHTVLYTGVFDSGDADTGFVVSTQHILPRQEQQARVSQPQNNNNGHLNGHSSINSNNNNNSAMNGKSQTPHGKSSQAGQGAASQNGHKPAPVSAPIYDVYPLESSGAELNGLQHQNGYGHAYHNGEEERFAPHGNPYPVPEARPHFSQRNPAWKEESRPRPAVPALFRRGFSKPALESNNGKSQSSSSMNDNPGTEYSGAPSHSHPDGALDDPGRLEQMDSEEDQGAQYTMDEAQYGEVETHGHAHGHTSALSLLGRSESRLPASPEEAVLETFANSSPHRDYLIQFQTEEFTSMCPVTGQPDFAKITIEYVPDILCIESKSLKFYLAAYRNERAFNEAVTNRILDDFVNAVQPRKATVKGAFAARGGISLSVTAEYVRPVEYVNEEPEQEAPASASGSHAPQHQYHPQGSQERHPAPAPQPKAPGAATPAEVPSRRPLLRRPLGQMSRGDNAGRPETETKVL